MSGFFIAPSERTVIAALGRCSSLPEKFGCDIMWIDRGVRYGIQRKEARDLKASVEDGRLGKEIGQARAAGVELVVVIEGRVTWTEEGLWVDRFGRQWTKSGWWGVQVSIQNQGAMVVWTEDAADTARFARSHKAWTEKKRHDGMAARPGPKGIWGTRATQRDFAVHVLTSFPGIGAEIAGRMYEKWGRVPLRWDVGEKELMEVEGLGKGRVKALLGVLK